MGLNPGSWQRARRGLLELAARCLTNVALPTNHTSATAAKNKAVFPHRHLLPVPSTQQHDQPLHDPVIQTPHSCQRGFAKCLRFLGSGDSNAATTIPAVLCRALWWDMGAHCCPGIPLCSPWSSTPFQSCESSPSTHMGLSHYTQISFKGFWFSAALGGEIQPQGTGAPPNHG